MKTSSHFLMALITVVVVLAAACGGSGPAGQPDTDKAAIQAALMKYLNERGTLNLAAMDVNIEDLKITGDRADAQVMFHTKQGQGEMRMAYVLLREQGTWVVQPQPRSETGMPHAGAAPEGAGELPASHPPITPPEKKPQP